MNAAPFPVVKCILMGRIRLVAAQRKRPARRAFVSVFVWLFVSGRVLVCDGCMLEHFRTQQKVN